MTKIALLASQPVPEGLPCSDLSINWTGRLENSGLISLEREMEQRLLSIRNEHMQWAFETGLLKYGSKSLSEKLECGEAPSMWWTSLLYERHPKLSPYLFDIYKLRCLECLLLKEKCTQITLYGGNRRLKTVLKKLCKSYNWKYDYKKDKSAHSFFQKGWRRKLYFWLPAPLRAAGRFLLWKIQIAAKTGSVDDEKWRQSEKKSGATHTATIVTYFPNIDLQEAAQGHFISKYWEGLHELLREQAGPNRKHFIHWLFIRFSGSGLSLKQCLALRDKFRETDTDGLTFNYLEEFLDKSGQLASIWRWLKLSWASLKLERLFSRNCRFANSSLDFWPYMRGQWAESFRGWRCLERCLQNKAFKNYFQYAGEQRWTLFPLENCPWERMLTVASREKNPGQPVYGCQHSIIRPTDFRYFDDPATFVRKECRMFQPDVIGGNGGDACRQLAQNGMPASYLWQLEALRYLYLARWRRSATPSDLLPPQAGEPLAYAGKKRLLVLTSFFRDETAAHLDLLKECLDTDVLDKWHIAIKPHPLLPVGDWVAGLKENFRNQIQVLSGSMENAFGQDSLVWTSNSTTAALEAILRGLPVMVMLPFGDFDLCPVQNVKGLWRTGNVEDVRTGLDCATAPELPHDYLDLNPKLPAWRKLLARQPGIIQNCSGY